MKLRLTLLIIVLLLMSKLDCTLIEVNLDGTADYTSIQSAINSANDNDVILVHPGHYIERLNTNGKDLTLQSLYALEPLQEYIDSTIVDGNRQVCLRIENGEDVTVNGFTFSNNYDDLNVVDTNQYTTVGGGIRIFEAGHLELKNIKAIKNISIGGSGISASGSNTSIYFENVEISNNRGIEGGGMILSSGVQVECNNLRVFNNFGLYGMDIFIGNYNDYQGTQIELSLGSALINEIDNYYVLDGGNSSPPYEAGIGNVTISVQEAYFPEIDQDVYVSPEGSNSNSGLSATEPLQTLVRAMQMIKSNPDNPNTVHVAPGTYSWSQNNQRFPFSLKSNTKLLGAGIDQTIIEGENGLVNIGGKFMENTEFGGMTFQNSSGYSYAPVWSHAIGFNYFHDLKYDRTTHINTTGFALGGPEADFLLENIIIQNNNSHTYSDLNALDFSAGTYTLNNIIIRNNKMFHGDNYELGIYAVNSNLDIRNLIITDCQGEDATLLNYYINQELYSDCTFEMHNALIFDNNVFTGPGTIRPVRINQSFNEDFSILISNSTIANNYGNRHFAGTVGNAKIYNSIFYNPNSTGDFDLSNFILGPNWEWVTVESSFYNNLFYVESPYIWVEDQVEQGDNLFSTNPHFLGEYVDSLTVSDVDYYRLSDNSPCIDAGFSDTSFLASTDLAGNARVWGNAVDIGAFEYNSEPVHNEDNEVSSISEPQILVYPNPVSRSKSKGSGMSNIEFVLPKRIKDKPVLTIYNLKGQKVKRISLENSYQDMQRHAGLKTNYADGQLYSTNWNLRNENNKQVASGLYFIQVKAGGYSASSKIMVLK